MNLKGHLDIWNISSTTMLPNKTSDIINHRKFTVLSGFSSSSLGSLADLFSSKTIRFIGMVHTPLLLKRPSIHGKFSIAIYCNAAKG